MIKVWKPGTTEKYSLRLVEKDELLVGEVVNLVIVNAKGEEVTSLASINNLGFMGRFHHVDPKVAKESGIALTPYDGNIIDHDSNPSDVAKLVSDFVDATPTDTLTEIIAKRMKGVR